MKVDENTLYIIERVKSITCGNYPIYWKYKSNEEIDGYIDSESLLDMSKDLLGEVEYLHELIEDMKRTKEECDEIDPHDKWLDYKEGIIK